MYHKYKIKSTLHYTIYKINAFRHQFLQDDFHNNPGPKDWNNIANKNRQNHSKNKRNLIRVNKTKEKKGSIQQIHR